MISLPGWNSIEETTKYHNIFEAAGIAFLALLVVADALAIIYGHRKDHLIEMQPKNFTVDEDARRQIAELTKNRWEPLTAEESLQIEQQLKTLDKKTIFIFVKDSNGYDLADSFTQLFGQLGWPTKKITSYFDLDETEDGIKCLPNNSICQQIIAATKNATNGRLEMRVGQSVNEGDINIVIGAKLP